MFVGLVLGGDRSGMLKFLECLGDLFWHVEGDGAFGMVPVDVDAAEEQAVSVHGDCVVFVEGVL
jgi:hypothetical protein